MSLQTLESWRGFIGGLGLRFKSNDTEPYFEADDNDVFLSSIDGLELAHPPVEHSWGQQGVRFIDPDGHIIEVGEIIAVVVKRFVKNGMSTPEIAARMDVKEEYVWEWLDELAKSEAADHA